MQVKKFIAERKELKFLIEVEAEHPQKFFKLIGELRNPPMVDINMNFVWYTSNKIGCTISLPTEVYYEAFNLQLDEKLKKYQ